MEKHDIDFYILWKKFNATLSLEEELQLKEWLSKSPEHEELYQEMGRFYKEGSTFNDSVELSENAFSKIQDRIKNRRRFNFSIAASIIVLIGFSVYYLSSNNILNSGNQTAKSANKEIPAGKKQAVLVLEDGTKTMLTTESGVDINQGNAAVKQSVNGLHYSSIEEADKTEVFNTLMIPRGGEFVLELSDGTKVWLNSETKIKYPVQFLANQRVVELDGEAYFEVAKDKAHPFIVKTGNQQVKVLGTQFNINSYSNYTVVRTTLVEGSVEVQAKDGQAIQLKPGFQSVLAKEEGHLTSQKVNVSSFVAWKEGMFHFIDEPLVDMMLTLERWYDVKFEYNNPNVKQIKFTGKIKRYESLNQVLLTIEKTKEVIFNIKGSQVLVD